MYSLCRAEGRLMVNRRTWSIMIEEFNQSSIKQGWAFHPIIFILSHLITFFSIFLKLQERVVKVYIRYKPLWIFGIIALYSKEYKSFPASEDLKAFPVSVERERSGVHLYREQLSRSPALHQFTSPHRTSVINRTLRTDTVVEIELLTIPVILAKLF